MIKAGIIGGAGYTAGELIRILLHHSEVKIHSVVSSSHAGDHIYKAHPDLEGETDLTFDTELAQECGCALLVLGTWKIQKCR